MAEEMQDTEQQGQVDNEAAKSETDWHAKYEAMREEMRKQEKRAKENAAAASELEQLKESQATEQEKAVKRAEKAEAELNELKAKAERAEVVARVADKQGIPAEAVAMLNGADADELAEQVERLLKLLPAYPTRTDDGGGKAEAKKSAAQLFADAVSKQR
ncbi:MAG: hypothetical protein IJ113_02365 [Eggerthellaceae bacterium]|nr:hypothetical protein [Eggerthellaceae bacterium]MBQ9147800.1 hypothetical protein [Rikenellaceae bacterium]